MNDSGFRCRALVVVAAFALFAGLPVQTHTHDGLTYALHVMGDDDAVRWHPHHPIYTPLVRLLWRAGCLVSPALHPLAVMQLLSALAGAAALWFLLGLLVHIPLPAPVAWSLALTAAFSFGPWRYATLTVPHVGQLTALAAALAAADLVRRRDASAAGHALPGLVLGLGTIVLQTTLLFLPAVAVMALGPPLPQPRRSSRLAACAAMVAGFLLVTGSGYLLSAMAAVGPHPGAMIRWGLGYTRDARWWGFDAGKPVVALVSAAYGAFGNVDESPSLPGVAAWASLLAVTLLAAAGLRRGLGAHRRLALTALAAMIPHVGLHLFLDVASPNYWLPVPMAVALLLAPGLVGSLHERPRLTTWALVALAVTGPLCVFHDQILPQSSPARYRPYHVARAVAAAAGPDAVIWTMGGQLEEKVLRVFTPLTVRSVHDEVVGARRPLEESVTDLRRRLDADLASGRPVFLFHDLFDGRLTTIRDMTGREVGPRELAPLLAGLGLRRALAARGVGVLLWRVEGGDGVP